MLAEKAADMIKEKDSVKAIRDYLQHMIIKKAQQVDIF